MAGKHRSSITPISVEEYVTAVPDEARHHFDELRSIVKSVLPDANEVISYGIIGYKIDGKQARVFISGWKGHVAMYPLPKDEALRNQLKPYIAGKGTLRFPLTKPLPEQLIKQAVQELAS